MSRKLTKPSIPPASPHLAGHYSGLHPEDQPYQSSQMIAHHPAAADTRERHPQEPEQIILPTFEPQTDPELYQPTALIVRQPKWRSSEYASLPALVRERFSRVGIGAPRFSSMALTLVCLLFLLASSVLAFVLIGNHASIATAAFSASPNSVQPGDTFTLAGSGFKSSSLLHFSLDSNQPIYDDAGNVVTTRTDERGAFSLQIYVPALWSVGHHTIFASDPSQGVSISTAITVAPPSSSLPDLQVADSKTSLTFPTMVAGTTSNQTLTLRNAGGGTVHWQASSDQPWLSVAPASGSFSSSASIQVTVNRGGLSAQSYSAHLTLAQQGSPSKSLRVTVTMGVTAPAALTPMPTALSFTGTTTQNPAAQSVVIQNSGGQPLDWNSSVTGNSSSWLSVSPSEGHLNPGVKTTLIVSVLTSQLAGGSYQGAISFTGDADAQIAVNLNVQVPNNLLLSQSSLTMSAQSNQPATPHTVTLQNDGDQPLDWTSSVTTADSGKWLSVTPDSGTLAVGEQATLTVKVQPGLPVGSYQGTVNFASQGQTRQLAISYTVTAPPIQMQTNALHFTAQKGTNPATQSLSMTNTSNTALNWTAKIDSTTPAFLSVSPLSGTIAPGQKISLTVSADITNASVGTISSGIDIVSTNDASVVLANEVGVDVVISDPAPSLAATPTALSFKQSASATPAAAQTFTITNSSTTASHWSLAQPAGKAQSWLTLSQTSGTLNAGANVPIAINCTGSKLTPGTYTATLQLFNTDVSTSTPVQTFTVTLTVA